MLIKSLNKNTEWKEQKWAEKNEWNGLLSRKIPQNIEENIRHLQAKNHPVNTRTTK